MGTFVCRGIGWTGPLEPGIAALHNGSDRPVDVRRVRVRFPGPTPTGAQLSTSTYFIAGRHALVSISALGDASNVTPDRHRSSSAALPAQVKIVGDPGPDSLTLGTRVFRSAVLFDNLINPAGFANVPGMSTRWATRRRMSSGSILGDTRDAAVEPFTLAEGEGVALVLQAIELPCVRQHSLTLGVAATGATWTVTWQSAPAATYNNGAVWAIFNGAGSGVSLQILNYSVFDAAEGYAPSSTTVLDSANTRLMRGPGLVRNGGSALRAGQIIGTTGAGVPSGLAFYKGPFRPLLHGQEAGVDFDWATTHGASIAIASQLKVGVLRRTRRVNQGAGVEANTVMTLPREWDTLFRAVSGEDGLILQPGQTLSVVGGLQQRLSSGCFDVFDVEMTCVRTDPKTAGIGQTRIT